LLSAQGHSVNFLSPTTQTTISRRDPTEQDVQIEILFCEICRSDLRAARNEWSEFMLTTYPIGSAMRSFGRVMKVGSAVTEFMPGDLAARWAGYAVRVLQSRPFQRQKCFSGLLPGFLLWARPSISGSNPRHHQGPSHKHFHFAKR
jgi:hypothetical protein